MYKGKVVKGKGLGKTSCQQICPNTLLSAKKKSLFMMLRRYTVKANSYII